MNAAAAAWVILVLWNRTNLRLSSFLENGLLRYLGRISYGLYLWHYPVILLLRNSHVFERGWQITIVSAILTVLLSALSFHGLERPILNWAHRRHAQPRVRVAYSSS